MFRRETQKTIGNKMKTANYNRQQEKLVLVFMFLTTVIVIGLCALLTHYYPNTALITIPVSCIFTSKWLFDFICFNKRISILK
jgi:hypothetical protein